MSYKVAVIGGGGVRTPLLLHGLASSGFPVSALALYDIDAPRAQVMATLGSELTGLPITVEPRLEAAVEGADFVISSIRVGGIAGRARDERIAMEHGLAGQETTGAGGAAMALRTVPEALAHARLVERLAPKAWLISFTNPAGLVTQAIRSHCDVKAIGICDTPSELIHRLGEVLGGQVECDYSGLNHLGWVSRVRRNGEDVTAEVLASDRILRGIYPADLFDPLLIRTLGLIPSEYLFFYYSPRKAYANQKKAGATRGGEIERMNHELFARLARLDARAGVECYRDYLRQRNASYLKLEAGAGSAFEAGITAPDPFAAATGYHRVAVDVMQALVSDEPRQIILNVQNHGAIEGMADDDVVEVPCSIDRHGPVPYKTGRLPQTVRGLVESVKGYERTLIRAAVENSSDLARLAMLQYPLVGDWELTESLLRGRF